MLAERPWLLADGATGTNFFAVGLPTGHAPELWNIDEPDKVPKGWTEKTYRRFQKVIGQRNDGRRLNAAQGKTIAGHESFMRNLSDKYGSYDNPTAVMLADASFMDAFEQLAKTTPSIAAIADQVKNFQSTGSIPVSDGQPIGNVDLRKDTAITPKTDDRVDKLIEQGARNTITATLESCKVKPAFLKIITDSLIAEGGDLSAISREGVIAKARAFIAESGFTASEVLTQVASPPAKDKPATRGGQRQAAVSDKTAQERENDTAGAPKSREEWIANRNKMRDAMFSE